MKASHHRGMARTSLLVLGLAVLLAAIGLTLSLRKTPSPATPRTESGAGAPRPEHIVVVTIDTLRADRVGAYGYRSGRTPVLDGLARGGVRFERAYAPTPITLPSHASLLTGLYPPGHGSRHNGMRVEAGVSTLAELLKAAGFVTGAFVAAFPLDRRFGLDQGFDTYSDTMPRGPDGRLRNERAGRAVVDEAMAWLGQQGTRRVFLWVHLFEPHAPYEGDDHAAVGARAQPVAERYDAEVARADVEVGRLIEALGPRRPSTTVVVASDHGEAFGEHGEAGHSVFVYDTTLRVPLVLSGAGVSRAGHVVAGEVSLLDVLPTVTDLLGLPTPDVDGRSFSAALRGEPVPRRELYAESFAPLLDFGWSALRSIRRDGVKYVAAPKPELYDLSADPAEVRNIVTVRSDQARDLQARADAYSSPELPASSAQQQTTPEAQRRLQALGYVGAGRVASQAGSRPDPKDLRELAARIAQVTSGELSGDALRAALESIVRDDPANGQAHLRLGFVLVEAGQCPSAERHFRAAMTTGIPSADPSIGLAGCLFARGDLAEAAEASRVLDGADAIEPGNPVVKANQGVVAMAQGRNDSAIASLESAVAGAPDFLEARFNLARAYARAGRRDDAVREARELLSRLPPASPQRAEVERLLGVLTRAS
ncbi:MAG: Sulfatase [Acidobacteria bacterium]|nr:Sulfatase [Acidobacteriota bacterium]